MSKYFADEVAPLKERIDKGEGACIIAIGSMPAKVLAKVDKVKHERGTVHKFAGIPLVITLEPAGLLWSKGEAKNTGGGQSRDYLPIVIKDLIKVKRIASGHAEIVVQRDVHPHPDEKQVEEMLTRVEKASMYGLDIETDYHIDHIGKNITMIGLSDRPGAAVTLLPWAIQKYRARLERIFADPDKTMVGWNNGQFDAWKMRDAGWVVNNRLYDAMLADHLVESDMGDFGLEAGASRHLDYEPWKHLPTTDPLRNCLDVSISLELEQKLTTRMRELGCEELLFRHQVPMSQLCAQAHRIGIRVDREAMGKAYIACQRLIERHESLLKEKLGPLFNRNSPQQMKSLLYDIMKLPVQLHRRTRKPTTDHYAMDDLVKLCSDLSSPPKWQSFKPILEAIVAIKQVDKMAGTFLSGENVHEDGRFHPQFLQHRQVTGRLSATDPNVMQLPQGWARAVLLPDEGHVWIKVDFSQIQMRLSGWFSGDETLNERLKYYDEHPLDEWGDKQDVHRLHANRFYGDVRLDRTKRSLSKNMFYGINFGQGAKGLATMYGVEESYSQNFIDFIWREYPQLKRWRDGILNTIEERNYLRNPYGRIRWLWNRNFATEAFIALPQMTEFDMVAESSLALAKELPSSVRQVMWVHDEIDLSCPAEIAHEVAEQAEEICGRPRAKLDGFRCPVKAQLGKNYNEASEEEGLAGDWRRLRRTVR